MPIKMEETAAPPEANEQDSFDKLELARMPLVNQSLKAGHLIKDAQMQTMFELINDPLAGSLQIRADEISKNFSISAADQELINKLASLGSYDVYSLRINLNKLGIKLESDTLDLSSDTKSKLAQYSLDFTRPLILAIFGNGEVNETENLQKLFRDSDRERVTRRLKIMSEKIGIPVAEIPDFLSDYKELYMSGSYYMHTFDDILRDVSRLYTWIEHLKSQPEVATVPRITESLAKTEEAMQFLCNSVIERMNEFKGGFESFWKNMSKKNFEKLRRQIEDNRTGLGAVLCGLIVKMRDWSRTFPDNTTGTVSMRIKYLVEMKAFLDKLQNMESEARLLSVVWQ